MYNNIMIEKCDLCPRMCHALRTNETGNGFCHLPDKIYISHFGLHNFEEPVISGKKGSGTIFFSGCNLGCKYCQNYKISRGVCGKPFSTDEFIELIKKLEYEMGAENINLVTPTPYSNKIIEALKKYHPNIPVIYNTSGYERPQVIRELMDYVDIFLTDFKYSDDNLAKKYSGVNNYVDTAKESLKIMLEKPIITNNDMLKSGVIVRHLILPGHIENTINTLKILDELNVKTISLMSQFTPTGNDDCDLNRKITKREYQRVLNAMYPYDFDGYVQDLTSANKKYIPDFCFIKK